jgi:hypothetical protein
MVSSLILIAVLRRPQWRKENSDEDCGKSAHKLPRSWGYIGGRRLVFISMQNLPVEQGKRVLLLYERKCESIWEERRSLHFMNSHEKERIEGMRRQRNVKNEWLLVGEGSTYCSVWEVVGIKESDRQVKSITNRMIGHCFLRAISAGLRVMLFV